jgi:hypothetical protein
MSFPMRQAIVLTPDVWAGEANRAGAPIAQPDILAIASWPPCA